MNEYDTNLSFLTDKQALFFYLLILPSITIGAFFSWTFLVMAMGSVFAISIILTLLGK